jgi:hypothetical protein
MGLHPESVNLTQDDTYEIKLPFDKDKDPCFTTYFAILKIGACFDGTVACDPILLDKFIALHCKYMPLCMAHNAKFDK